ncbi:lytic transglycosylase domain-containing protein [Trinickia fusca]|uniref:Lytic transglycosylase domain-containing protein n=1 Tax=Trinickia fusca TaxID=2419777 RepID=A0A494XAD3_9BURK|nr:lytic transglycosylase domain-containing protein [Trinickia fusca]RKP44553.1 lytic transglycosylase domain-containing protein [Trinickia fusca]
MRVGNPEPNQGTHEPGSFDFDSESFPEGKQTDQPGQSSNDPSSSIEDTEQEIIQELEQLLEELMQMTDQQLGAGKNSPENVPGGGGGGGKGHGHHHAPVGEHSGSTPHGEKSVTPHGSHEPTTPTDTTPTDTTPTDTNNDTPLVKGKYTASDLGTLPPALKPFENDILNAANKSGIPPNVLAGQIYQESRGKINAGSTNQGTGLTDAGLMQVDPATFDALRKEHPDLGPNLSDPATNILAGAYYDEDMANKFGGSIPLMLRAYNSGPNGVDRNDANAIPAGTGDPNYVKLVMEYADDIKSGKPLPA